MQPQIDSIVKYTKKYFILVLSIPFRGDLVKKSLFETRHANKLWIAINLDLLYVNALRKAHIVVMKGNESESFYVSINKKIFLL